MDSGKVRYRIGYTTGAFDMFHIGHLNLLERIKAMCGKLIVGISTDESMARLKGMSPVVPWEQRARIVGALECVDEVVPNAIVEHEVTWHKLKFDLFAIGEDWKGRMDNTERELGELGCDVIYLPRTEGISTTSLKERVSHYKTLA
jgi:glycerol-3-phosphate cytidylyltransferase